MEKEFEAHYSKTYALLFAFLLLLFLFGIIMFSIFWIPDMSLAAIIIFSLVSVVCGFMFVVTIRKDGIAVQVADDKLILYKKELIEIPICDITKISIHDGDGSFDISIKARTRKYSMHCFIKEQRKKKNELISLLKDKGILVNTFDSTPY